MNQQIIFYELQRYFRNPPLTKTKVKLFCLVLLLFSASFSLNAQLRLVIVSTSETEENGVDTVHIDEFRDRTEIDIYLRNMINKLHSSAYLEASADSITVSEGLVTAFLHKGRKYDRIIVSLDHIDEQVLRANNIRAARYGNNVIDIQTFRNLQNRLLDHYENSGYPFAEISLCPLQINHDTISGNLMIELNSYYTIDSIHIYGNSEIKRRYLYRHLGIQPGDPYSEKRLKEAGEIIRRTRFLSEVREPEVEFMSRSADLYIYADHRQASYFSGILGFQPGTGDDKPGLAGELNLSLSNVFRRMEIIRLDWQSPGREVQLMNLNLVQPYLFGRQFGIDLHLHMYKQDSTYLKVEAEAGIPITIAGGGTIRLFGKTTGTSLIAATNDPDPAALNVAGVNGQVFGISFFNDKTDNPVNPYRGWMINGSLGAGNKTVSSPPGYTGNREKRNGFAEATNRLDWFLPVSASGTILFSSLSGIKINFVPNSEENFFFENELFLLGGYNTIRGFDERSLSASSYVINRIEYRYLFDHSGNLFLFFDGMAYARRLPDKRTTDLPFGFGAGITLGTRAGQFSLSYAIGREQGNPVSSRASRIHFGIINRF